MGSEGDVRNDETIRYVADTYAHQYANTFHGGLDDIKRAFASGARWMDSKYKAHMRAYDWDGVAWTVRPENNVTGEPK